MTDQADLPLNDGRALPRLGLGTWQLDDGGAERIVDAAIVAGYRAIDTAAVYANEAGVGAAVRAAGARVVVTSKLWNDAHARDAALRAFDATMARLGLDILDLYLIHWPVPAGGRTVEAWRTLIELRDAGRIASIGVSNFRVEDLERIIGETGVVPAVNQIELHPAFQQRVLRDFHARHAIVTESWSPLGRARVLDDPAIGRIAAKHGRSPAQVVLGWHVALGLAVIPKTGSIERLAENRAALDVALDAEDMAAIAALDRADGRAGPDPTTFGG